MFKFWQQDWLRLLLFELLDELLCMKGSKYGLKTKLGHDTQQQFLVPT